MSQSKKHSVMEAITSTAVGFLVTWFAGLVIYPLVGVQVSTGQNTVVVLLFTVVSLVRGYVLRRYFNRLTVSIITSQQNETENTAPAKAENAS
jgi:membrane protein implicated in regulation of membrane protease activity